jgi:methionine synthase II (cobalamin-independent)
LNVSFPKFLGFVSRKIHFFVMDSKIMHAACIGAVVTVIATGVAIIEQERNRNYIPRESRINAIAQ